MNTSLVTKLFLVTLLIAFLIMPDTALANADSASSSGDDSFVEIYDWLKGIVQGTLGKLIALASFLVGMAIGITRQSAMAVVVGIGIAIALVYGPNVIDGIFTATLPSAEMVTIVEPLR
jgi:conjugal transfer pilus assembly protein TraA